MFDPLIAPLAVMTGLVLALVLARRVAAAGKLALPDQSRRTGHVDGLRGLLAPAVMVQHFAVWVRFRTRGGTILDLPDVPAVVAAGQVAVALFFMISAALFYDRVTRGMGLAAWVRLYLSRLFRIMPLVFAVVAIGLGMLWCLGGRPVPGDAGNLWRIITFQGTPPVFGGNQSLLLFSAFWTLRVEWIFYLALPLVALGAAAIPRPGLRIAGLTLAAGLAMVLLFPHLACFLLGYLAVELGRQPRATRVLQLPAFGWLALLLIVGQVAFVGTIQTVFSGWLLLVLFLAVRSGNPVFAWLGRPGFLTLGEWSYSIYLLHSLVLFALFAMAAPTLAAPSWWLFPPALMTVVLLAGLSHRWIELPGIRAGKRLAAALSPGVVVQAGPPISSSAMTSTIGRASASVMPTFRRGS
ncbi:acyltransferase family protein [Frigidibacter sp. ROC022]|uniref:acyltransferase family protein n=1 Tax=Frigidibacter sp. ROC022 TaxID=2971796 RepID=UPI00215A324B|nr:acyltransferase [Frigidibacter sp. ROC022]MCR8722879.1 acyltransferase [Frigidibacter sp. ROC022]